ncbi:MAG: respiratory chain complex I subunit 1 family protein, partial [Thermoplasmata archaeon]
MTFPLLQTVGLLAAEYLFVLGLSPLFIGLLRRVKARAQDRSGPPLLQPYRDLAKLLRKDRVMASSASAVSRYASRISFAALLAAIPWVPWLFLPSPLGGMGDLILLVGLLALSRFFQSIQALDAGTAFGGMGSSREMWMGALAEPVFLLVIFAFGGPAGSTQAGVIALRGISLGAA